MSKSLAENRFMLAFPPEWRERLGALAETVSYDDGVFLFREGDEADGVLLVLDGRVEIVREVEVGFPLSLHVVEAGDFLGELAVLDHRGRSAGARAVGATTVARLLAAPLRQLLREAPGAAILELFGSITNQVRRSNDRFVQEVLQRERLSTLGGMAASIIHDFKSPLTGIELASQLLEAKHGGDEAVGRYCGRIRQQSARMIAMVQELLDFSRGRPDLRGNTVELAALLAELEELNREFLRAREVTLQVGPTDAMLWCDRDRLLRVLQNLLSNAVTAFAGQPGHVRLEAQPAGDDHVVIRLADNGPGIPEEVKPRLFEPFCKSAASKGSGLGMAIAKAVVDAHGGEITFTSSAQDGTCFELRLPLRPARAE